MSTTKQTSIVLLYGAFFQLRIHYFYFPVFLAMLVCTVSLFDGHLLIDFYEQCP